MRCITGTVTRVRSIITGVISEFCPWDLNDYLVSSDPYLIRTKDGYYITLPVSPTIKTVDGYILRSQDKYCIRVK